MIKKIVAIGGGENGRKLENGKFAPYQTEKIDKEIVNLTKKPHPNFLFLGHAMYDSLEIQESYYKTMKKIYGDKFKCKCRNLKSNELYDLIKVKEYIEWADIIYVGGGDTKGMIELWKETGFDKILYDAWQKGKVICGISAGAVCWFNSCNSDSNFDENNQFSSVDCLNWINIHITPHGDEIGRYASTKEQLRENQLIGIMLSNCSALEIIDEQYKFIRSDDKAFALKLYYKNDKYEEKECIFDLNKNIHDLLEKN